MAQAAALRLTAALAGPAAGPAGAPRSVAGLASAAAPRQCALRAARPSPGLSGARPARRAAAVRCQAVSEAPASVKHNDYFTRVKTSAEVVGGLKALAEKGLISQTMLMGFLDFFQNFTKAVLSSGKPEAEAVRVFAAICDRTLVQFETPYTFPSYHARMLTPYNYYNFGQDYGRSLCNLQASVLGNEERFAAIAAQLAAGHNVVLLANHQTEADPAVFALLLEARFPTLAQEVVYIAGDRVVTDPLCKPFSMGRNLLCVYSKKHINDDPSLFEAKSSSNRRTLKVMSEMFEKGGNLIWIAPSGGRDRPDASGTFVPAKFDAAAIELMRKLTTSAPHPAHLYPLAMVSHGVMPPPPTLEKAIGERRLVFYSGVGMSVGPEMDVPAIHAAATPAGAAPDKKAMQQAVCEAAFAAVAAEYLRLEEAVSSGKTLPGMVRP